jgi:hypothetical protein
MKRFLLFPFLVLCTQLGAQNGFHLGQGFNFEAILVKDSLEASGAPFG